jgi:glycosyltransferase involved in cell wall biosynthesis
MLSAALLSVLSQSHPSVEVTVVDNGSRPPVEEVLPRDLLAATRLVRNPSTLPRTENYNVALASGTAPYVALLADDDEWDSRFLERATDVLAARPDVVLVHTGYTGVGPDGRRIYAVERPAPGGAETVPGHRYIEWLLAGRGAFEFTATVFRRSALPPEGLLPQDDFADDIGLLLRTALWGTVAFVNEPLARIRLHADTVTAAGSLARPDERYRQGLEYRLQAHDAKVRFLESSSDQLSDVTRLHHLARTSLRRHLLVPAARSLRRRTGVPAVWHSLRSGVARDRRCLLDPQSWKWALAAYLEEPR